MVTYPSAKASIEIIFEYLFICSSSYIGSNGAVPMKCRGLVTIVNDKLVQTFDLYWLVISNQHIVNKVLTVLYLLLACLADFTGPLL